MDINYAWELFERTGSVKAYIAYKAASDHTAADVEKVRADAYQNNGNRPFKEDNRGE